MMPDQTREESDLKPTLLYQDEWLVAVNKPSGLLVHRSWLDKGETDPPPVCCCLRSIR